MTKLLHWAVFAITIFIVLHLICAKNLDHRRSKRSHPHHELKKRQTSEKRREFFVNERDEDGRIRGFHKTVNEQRFPASFIDLNKHDYVESQLKKTEQAKRVTSQSDEREPTSVSDERIKKIDGIGKPQDTVYDKGPKNLHPEEEKTGFDGVFGEDRDPRKLYASEDFPSYDDDTPSVPLDFDLRDSINPSNRQGPSSRKVVQDETPVNLFKRNDEKAIGIDEPYLLEDFESKYDNARMQSDKATGRRLTRHIQEEAISPEKLYNMYNNLENGRYVHNYNSENAGLIDKFGGDYRNQDAGELESRARETDESEESNEEKKKPAWYAWIQNDPVLKHYKINWNKTRVSYGDPSKFKRYDKNGHLINETFVKIIYFDTPVDDDVNEDKNEDNVNKNIKKVYFYADRENKEEDKTENDGRLRRISKRNAEDDSIVFLEDLEGSLTDGEAKKDGVDPFDITTYTKEDVECFAKGKFLYEGQCHFLLDSCGGGNQLVLEKSPESAPALKLTAVCKPKKCKPGEVFWDERNECIAKAVAKSMYCSRPNWMVSKDSYGDGICKCIDNYGIFINTTDCHAYYQKGPCPVGKVVTHDKESGYAICTEDKCAQRNRAPPRTRPSRPKNTRITKRSYDHHVSHYANALPKEYHEEIDNNKEFNPFYTDSRSLSEEANQNSKDSNQYEPVSRSLSGDSNQNDKLTMNSEDTEQNYKINEDSKQNHKKYKDDGLINDMEVNRKINPKFNVQNYDTELINGRYYDVASPKQQKRSLRKVREIFDELSRRKRDVGNFMYAPMNGDGMCYRLGSPDPCTDLSTPSEKYYYILSSITHVPLCISDTKLHLIDAPAKCRVDSNNQCKDSLQFVQETQEQFLLQLKNQNKRRGKRSKEAL